MGSKRTALQWGHPELRAPRDKVKQALLELTAALC